MSFSAGARFVYRLLSELREKNKLCFPFDFRKQAQSSSEGIEADPAAARRAANLAAVQAALREQAERKEVALGNQINMISIELEFKLI